MKKNDWSTRKFYGTNGTLIKMEHTYKFQNQYYNNHNHNNINNNSNNPSKYVYYNDKSPQNILQKEKSMYKSDLDFPYPWREKIVTGGGDDSDEERKIKEEWFDYVKSKRLGKNWKDEKKRLVKEENNRNLVVHHDKFYEEWVKRKTMFKKSFITFKLLSVDKWEMSDKSGKSINYEKSVSLNEFKPDHFATNSSYLDGLPYHPEVFSNVLAAFPDAPLKFSNDVQNHADVRFVKENNRIPPVLNVPDDEETNCDHDVPYNDSKYFIESPPDNFAKAPEPKLEINDKKFDMEMDSSDCIIERRTIFKNPTTGKVKSFRSDMECVLTAKWENKNVDIIFYNWVFIHNGGKKLTVKDSLRSYVKIGQDVNFHGARSIPETDKYQTYLVYDGNMYPTLASRSGYDLKKWFIDKELYTFPRRAVVKSLVLPFHAVIDIEAPARNLTHKITSVAMENCFVNKNDQFHPEGWIDEFVKIGDVIYVELIHSKSEGTVSIKKAWKFPEEKIITPKPITSPNFEVPKDKFVFSCREGKKSCPGTVSYTFSDRGILVTKIKDKTGENTYEIHFDHVYIDGYEGNHCDLQVGTNVIFRNFRKPPSCDEFWTPLVWKGSQPSLHDLMKKYEMENDREAVVDAVSIYVGKIEQFILPSHAVIKTKSNNDLVIFVSVSKSEILPEAPDRLWIDKIVTMNDVLTFKIKKLSQDRYAAVQVYA